MNSIRQKVAVLAVFASAAAQAAQAAIVINEVHYDPDVKTELVEFIELHNTGSEPIALGGWRFSDGISFQFPPGSDIAAGGYLVVAQDPGALQSKFNTAALGPWTGILSNEGETITLENADGDVIDTVSYKLGFPWPTVGTAPGYSMELVNPQLDNDLGGSWRPSAVGNTTSEQVTLVGSGGSWKYLRGESAPSSPTTAWREPAFDDSSWSAGTAPIGYDPSIFLATRVDDMRNNFTSVFFRKNFHVENPSAFSTLHLQALYDDGFKVWINGVAAISVNISSGEVPYNGTAGPARESANFEDFIIPSPAFLLRQGENTIAIQAHNSHISNSSDFYLDLRLIGQTGPVSTGPTPGARNVVFSDSLPPHLRQVNHSPEQPRSSQPVTISVKVTDPDGVAAVQLAYQVVEPGSYIELDDAAYETSWTELPMHDNGFNGDTFAGDSIFTTLIPATVQQHRRLIRYRITATDNGGRSLRAPHLDDPVPNFAYFVYDGTPPWTGAARPGVTPPETISHQEMSRLPVYHLIAKRSAVESATWTSKYTGDQYRWGGTLVYDGKVYDHIRYRARGGVWRYAMGKNMWKFDFNKGHDFQARDNYGREYDTTWRKLNLGANIQQGNYHHRGEQGMFESVGFRLFNLAGVESPKTHWATLRIIDDAAESGSTQFEGDFWGLYLAIEQEDGRFLDEHNLPDGNLYKMESGTGELNNQGRTEPTDKSDLNSFLSTYRGTTPSLDWWRNNLDAEKYFSYQAIVQGIHHYDICDGKNYFYYRNPETGLWSVHSWDLDLTWANNMYRDCAGADDLKNRVLANSTLSLEHKNRLREIHDLLFNPDQAIDLVQEYAAIVKGAEAANILAADRAMWDYNPVMANGNLVNLSKAGQGLFYNFPLESASDPSLRGSFDAGVRIMTNYVVERSAFIASLAHDTAIPARPSIFYAGSENSPLNRLALRSSNYYGQNPFAAMEWRVGEVRAAAQNVPGIYEIEPVWESGEIASFNSAMSIPPDALKVGHTYRARVRMKDATGRWSHWSLPLEFATSEPDNVAALRQHLRLAELMYNPPAGSDFEFIELRNSSSDITLQIGGVAFTDGIEFAFPEGATLAPGQSVLVTKFAPEQASALRQHYGLSADVPIFGPMDGNLNNGGEQITLKSGVAGTELFSFTYNNRAGWPAAADGTGHSLVATGDHYDYPGNWRQSAQIGGSPGSTSLPYSAPVLINEIAAHTELSNPEHPDHDSNDWIELVSAENSVLLEHYFLSDDANNLKKWQLPVTTLQARQRITFDEITGFHNPITAGFGVDQAGEALFLSHLPPDGTPRVVDAVSFKGQEPGRTWGRYPDGGAYFLATLPTRDQLNSHPEPTLLISEIMYHPPDDSASIEPVWQEFLEMYNPGSEPVSLATETGTYRIDGGLDYTFPPGLSIPAKTAILLVSFDPADGTMLNQFLNHYQVEDISVFGPYSGKLGNSSDRVAMEMPQAPDVPGEPVAWVVVDEVIYADRDPWPGADGNAQTLHRSTFTMPGNDPANWQAGAPTPGRATNSTGELELAVALLENGDIQLSFQAVAGQSYSILVAPEITAAEWTELHSIQDADETVQHTLPTGSPTAFYKVVTPALAR